MIRGVVVSASGESRAVCLAKVTVEYEDGCTERVPCAADAVALVTITYRDHEDSAYGCAWHTEKTVVGFQNGMWRDATGMTVEDLETVLVETAERIPTPADVLRSLQAEVES